MPEYIPPKAVSVKGPRGTIGSAPEHMIPALVQRGYEVLSTPVAESGAAMSPGDHLDPDGTAGYQPGAGDNNPFA